MTFEERLKRERAWYNKYSGPENLPDISFRRMLRPLEIRYPYVRRAFEKGPSIDRETAETMLRQAQDLIDGKGRP
ncbi:MAG: hypothetical protein V2A79_10185 [Planctomycetota bacterium]